MTHTKNTKACTECGKNFEVKWPKNPNLYCSAKCRAVGSAKKRTGKQNVNWKPKVTIRCDWCDSPFDVAPSAVPVKRFCSKTCDSAWRRTVTGTDHPLYKPKVRMACEVCGTERMVKPSLVGRFRACSRRCAAALVEMPRSSSLETATKAVLDLLGESYEQQARFRWYSVDFYLPERNTVIECDGSYWHSLPKQQRIDKAKDSYLRNRGVSVVRITEEEIRRDVWSAVVNALHATPPPRQVARLESD